MAPAKSAARSRRTHSYSWSSDSSALQRPVYQWPDHSESSDDHLEHDGHRPSPTGLGNLYEGDESDASFERVDTTRDHTRGASRAFKPALGKKINYDSDSCLTPRSRRTLRRTLSGVTEPWPSVTTPAAKPALDTIYSPTHEILHPMQSLLLEKSLSEINNKPLVSFVTVRTSTKGSSFTPTRMTQSMDFDSFKSSSYHKPKAFKLAFPAEAQADAQDVDDSASTGGIPALQAVKNVDVAEAARADPRNIVVIIVDAEKKPAKLAALDWAINVAVQPGDEIVILGVLKHVSSPMGYKVVASTDPSVGVKPELLQSEVKKITEVFEHKLSDSGRRAQCEKKNVKLSVRIAPGARARTVVVRELAALKATYAVFDRRVMRGTRYYNKHLSCHAVRMRSNGRSTKTIFTTTQKMSTTTTTTTPRWPSSSSPTSDTGATSGEASSASPTHFWRRFSPFKSSRSKWSPSTSSLSPRSSTASSEVASPYAAVDSAGLNLESFMSEMQDFSISLDEVGAKERSKQALQSYSGVADACSYKHGMDAHRIKHRPISVIIPPICAT